MDSCMRNTGAGEDHFECLGEALAWSSRFNSQRLKFKPNLWSIFHEAGEG